MAKLNRFQYRWRISNIASMWITALKRCSSPAVSLERSWCFCSHYSCFIWLIKKSDIRAADRDYFKLHARPRAGNTPPAPWTFAVPLEHSLCLLSQDCLVMNLMIFWRCSVFIWHVFGKLFYDLFASSSIIGELTPFVSGVILDTNKGDFPWLDSSWLDSFLLLSTLSAGQMDKTHIKPSQRWS